MEDVSIDDVLLFIRSWISTWGGTSSEVALDAQLRGDVGLDSLGMMGLLTALEERFLVAIPDEDPITNGSLTVCQLSTLVASRLEG